MKLIEAIPLNASGRMAFVGAGGKSTAMFRLAREWGGPVLVSASANLGVGQAEWADRHLMAASQDDLTPLAQSLPEGLTLVTAGVHQERKLSGLPPELLGHLRGLAGAHRVPLLIEADGSRRRALKAPAEHEPPIPAFADAVVVVAGLSAIGKPLNEKWVHRPERYELLSGLAPGEIVTAEAATRVLIHPEGGLKSIPDGARRVALLNQADTAELAGAGWGMAADLLAAYKRVVVARLERTGEEEVLAVHRKVAGVVLAAGGSSRMETPKPLLTWRGKPFVRAVAETALAAGLDPVVVVTGPHREAVESALSGMNLTAVHNPAWEAGQSASLKVGLGSLPEEVGAVVFFLVDMPQTPATLVEAIVAEHSLSQAPIVAPMIGAKRGNPVLFDRATFAHLEAIQGDEGGRQVFAKYPIRYVPWVDEAAGLDVDTPEDYARLLNFE